MKMSSIQNKIDKKLAQGRELKLNFIGLTFNTCIRLGHGQPANDMRSKKPKYPQMELELIVEGAYWAIVENGNFVIDVNDKIDLINPYIETLENGLILSSISIKNRNILLNYDKNISIIVVSSEEEEGDPSDWYLSIDGHTI